MQARKLFFAILLGATFVAGGILIARSEPAQNIDPARHPNLAAAQALIVQAYDKIGAAQKANDWDMAGHAAHAKQLLDQASEELKAAALAANKAAR